MRYLADVVEGNVVSEIQAEVGQLQSDICHESLGRDAVEDAPVGVGHGAGGLKGIDVLAEQGGVGAKTGVVERTEDRHGLVDRLPRDEPGGAEAHAVAPDAARDAPIARGDQDALAESRIERLANP